MVEYHAASDSASSFETQVVARDVFSTTLDGLTPSTEYDVRVRGENAVGCSVPSATRRTKTDDEVTERVDSGDLEEDELSTVGSLLFEASEEDESDPRVQEEVGSRNDGISNSVEICEV